MADSRLIEVQLRVADLERSARFYRDVVGVPLERSEPHPPANEPHYEAAWGTWGGEGRDFTLFLLYPAGNGVHTTGATVGFSVRDLDEVHAKAEAKGVGVIHPPQEEPWGRSAEYEDPDGNVVAVTEAPQR